ncbi:MAG: branched-chain amino acid aminotransferase [Vicingus serpentipes]|nr:branched-chain amino acid aminotransferase [Vicingus serpentipes]
MLEAVSKIQIQKATKSKISEIDFNNITFGKQFSDHMFTADYKNGEWQNFKIEPFQPITLSPSCAALHYGQSVFEGMKAYKGADGQVFLFRPEANAKRMNVSAARMCMPEIPEDLFVDAIKQLVALDSDWVSSKEGSSLYIRPFLFASEELLGVGPANEYKFIIFTSPAGAYYSGPVHVKIETEYSRACEGGVGFAKAAGNYAASLYPAKLAKEEGFVQLVWTDAKEHKYIEEAGTMNIMFHIGNKLITPNVDLKTTLPGITRDSILTLARDMGVEVEERKVSVAEIMEAAKNRTLKDAFGTGTAVSVAQISSITNNGERFDLPAKEERTLSNELTTRLDGIKTGKLEDPYHWVVKI